MDSRPDFCLSYAKLEGASATRAPCAYAAPRIGGLPFARPILGVRAAPLGSGREFTEKKKSWSAIFIFAKKQIAGPFHAPAVSVAK
jgi:hypothetical protein